MSLSADDLPHLDLASANVVEETIAELRDLIPSAFGEDGNLDWDRLRLLLGEHVSDEKEQYGLNWAGKREAIQAVRVPSTGTLVPMPEESVDWDTTENVIIEGDNLEVLKLLQKSYHQRVKMIYIDPPYNTGNDFIYPDNFREGMQTYLEYTGQTTRRVSEAQENQNRSGRMHSAWLSMMYPRLFLAKNLLRDDGVIFVSIDDHEVANLRALMNEVFGEENFVAVVAALMNPRGRHLDEHIARTHESLMVYVRDANVTPTMSVPKDARMLAEYRKRDSRGFYRELELRNRNPRFNSVTRPRLFYPFYVCRGTDKVLLDPTESHTIPVLPRNSVGGIVAGPGSRAKRSVISIFLLQERRLTAGGYSGRTTYLQATADRRKRCPNPSGSIRKSITITVRRSCKACSARQCSIIPNLSGTSAG